MGEIMEFFARNGNSFFASFFASLIFFILGPVILSFSNRKIIKEKKRRARASFIDTVEGILVNNENIDIGKMKVLWRATQRENDLNLEGFSNIIELLEDVSLAFAKSKHLSFEQKNAYSDQIKELIDEFVRNEELENGSKLPSEIKAKFDDLLKKIDTKDDVEKDEIVNDILKIRSKINLNKVNIYGAFTNHKKSPFIAISIILIFSILFSIIFFGINVLSNNNQLRTDNQKLIELEKMLERTRIENEYLELKLKEANHLIKLLEERPIG